MFQLLKKAAKPASSEEDSWAQQWAPTREIGEMDQEHGCRQDMFCYGDLNYQGQGSVHNQHGITRNLHLSVPAYSISKARNTSTLAQVMH